MKVLKVILTAFILLFLGSGYSQAQEFSVDWVPDNKIQKELKSSVQSVYGKDRAGEVYSHNLLR